MAEDLNRFDSKIYLIDQPTLTSAFSGTVSSEVSVAGRTTAAIWFEYTTGKAGATVASKLYLKILGNPDAVNTTDDFQEVSVNTTTSGSSLIGHIYTYLPDDGEGGLVIPVASTTYRRMLKVDIEAFNRIQIDAKEVLGAGNDAGSLKVFVTMLS